MSVVAIVLSPFQCSARELASSSYLFFDHKFTPSLLLLLVSLQHLICWVQETFHRTEPGRLSFCLLSHLILFSLYFPFFHIYVFHFSPFSPILLRPNYDSLSTPCSREGPSSLIHLLRTSCSFSLDRAWETLGGPLKYALALAALTAVEWRRSISGVVAILQASSSYNYTSCSRKIQLLFSLFAHNAKAKPRS